jgi:hypothetical protein
MTIDASPPGARGVGWRRLRRRLAITLGVMLTVVAMLCCAGVAYVLYDGYRAPREQESMQAFARDLCHDLVAGDAGAVYAVLSVHARQRRSADELAGGLASRVRLTRCDVIRATYLFLLVAYVVIDTTDGRHSFDLVKEGGEWRVDSDILDDLDHPPSHGGGSGGFGD